jgi:hypothetical protein
MCCCFAVHHGVHSVQGFLPEAADQFVQDYIYKAFSPTVGLFLACSTLYGVWKTRQDDTSKK